MKPIEWDKVWALMRRDIISWGSYKMQVFIAIAGALIGFASWGFNAGYRNATVTLYSFGSTPVATISYLSFIITGILVSNVVLSLTSGVTSGLRPWMIESILMTGMRPSPFLKSISITVPPHYLENGNLVSWQRYTLMLQNISPYGHG